MNYFFHVLAFANTPGPIHAQACKQFCRSFDRYELEKSFIGVPCCFWILKLMSVQKVGASKDNFWIREDMETWTFEQQ